MPFSMAAWNVLFFIITLVAEGRIKPNVARYAVQYAMTIYPAAKGDIQPFLVVFQSC